jgi:hypothetical protein
MIAMRHHVVVILIDDLSPCRARALRRHLTEGQLLKYYGTATPKNLRLTITVKPQAGIGAVT